MHDAAAEWSEQGRKMECRERLKIGTGNQELTGMSFTSSSPSLSFTPFTEVFSSSINSTISPCVGDCWNATSCSGVKIRLLGGWKPDGVGSGCCSVDAVELEATASICGAM